VTATAQPRYEDPQPPGYRPSWSEPKPDLPLWQKALATVLIVVCAIALLFGMVQCSFAIPRSACRQKADGLGTAWRWGPIAGCLVQVDGRWAPLENVRIINGQLQMEPGA